VIATMSECLPEATANRLMSAGIVPFFGVDEALDALNAAAMIGNCTAPQPDPLKPDAARQRDHAE
jgi:hypothetical protein